jgi:hypothetical protein
MGFKTQIKSIQNKNHYLCKANSLHSRYLEECIDVLDILNRSLKPKKMRTLLVSKLQFHMEKFNEPQYIQEACELSVSSYFAKKFPETFVYEDNVNPANNSDVDCSFKDSEFKFCIEVKCAEFANSPKNTQIGNRFKIGSAGRLQNFFSDVGKLTSLMNTGLQESDEQLVNFEVEKNKDNNLKDFLVSANNKFDPNSSKQIINVLVVSCGNQSDMQKWFNYLFSHEGLFTETPYYKNYDEYSNVDIVVLTNLYHKHHNFFEKRHLRNHWSLEDSFNLMYYNPLAKQSKYQGINHFGNLLDHFTPHLYYYDPPCEAPPEIDTRGIKEATRVTSFIRYELEDKGVHFF